MEGVPRLPLVFGLTYLWGLQGAALAALLSRALLFGIPMTRAFLRALGFVSGEFRRLNGVLVRTNLPVVLLSLLVLAVGNKLLPIHSWGSLTAAAAIFAAAALAMAAVLDQPLAGYLRRRGPGELPS